MRTFLAAVLALAASGAHAMDLLEAYTRALAYDPAARAAVEALAAGREKAVQGDALLRPQVSLSGGYGYLRDQSSGGILPAESSGATHQAALQLKQPLYDAKAVADRLQLRERTGLAELGFRTSRQELMQRVSEAYLEVLLARETLRVVLAERAAIGMQRDRAQARFAVGRAAITDVQETQARYDSVLTREVSARSALELRRAQFQELTGTAPDGLAELRARFEPTPPQPNDLQAWQAKSAVRNTRVQARQSELQIATAETAKHRLEARPSLDLVAGYTYKGQDGRLPALLAPDNNRQATIGVQLAIPLYAGGGLDSREREAAARRREAHLELDASRRDARLQVQNAFLAVQTGVARIGALEQSVLSAHTAQEATALGRDVGSRTELDVLDAQQRLFSVQLDLAQARNDYLLGRIRLAAAAGELDERDLREINAYLRK